MKIALFGYGKMGKSVEAKALARGHTTPLILNSKSSLSAEMLAHLDICIDFSHPKCVLHNISIAASAGKNIVVGTTGWDSQYEEAKQIIGKSRCALLYAPNFSLGIALFKKIIDHTASLMAPFESYDVSGVEIHHNKKIDSPSGTALTLSETLNRHLPRKNGKIAFASLRIGEVPGTHSVLFDSAVDTITLTHTARNREGFAEGAVYAAEWLCDKKGIYTIDDIIS
jgi:4-hydroxy-tetrahydrodipicolinate reductase